VNVQLTSTSTTRKSLVVTLDKTEVDSEHSAILAEYVKQARLPGFRPGKAPVEMIKRKFTKELADELKQKVVSKAYSSSLEKEKLDVLSIVQVDEGKIELGSGATVTITVDVRPDFTLPEYVGLTVKSEKTEASEDEVEKMVEALRTDKADFKQSSTPAKKGDYVKLSYEGTLDGKPIADLVPDKQLYGKVPMTWEEVEGANEGHLPSLSKQLVGATTGEKKTVSISFPADFNAVAALAGKNASYAIEVLEIRERVLPALDEEFFKSHQVANLEELKTQIRANLKMQKEYQNQMAQRRQVLDILTDKTEVTIPDSLVDNETQGILRQFIEENMRRGVSSEEIEKDKKTIVEGAKKTAEKRVKTQLILSKIAEKEKITIENRDFDNYIYREANRTRQRPEKIAKDLGNNREALRAAQESIIFDKAVDFLVSKATVSSN
jgi:trigger factor